jgi:Phage tail tube protein, GTA-gp10
MEEFYMANKQRGESKLVLGGKEVSLRYDLNALVELEEKMGVPLSEMGEMKITIRNVRAMLWAGLIHENEELTEKEVGGLVDMQNMEEVQVAISEAFNKVQAKN